MPQPSFIYGPVQRDYVIRTYHFVGEFGETVVRTRPNGECWLFRPGKADRIITRSQAAAVILALDATQERGADWRMS